MTYSYRNKPASKPATGRPFLRLLSYLLIFGFGYAFSALFSFETLVNEASLFFFKKPIDVAYSGLNNQQAEVPKPKFEFYNSLAKNEVSEVPVAAAVPVSAKTREVARTADVVVSQGAAPSVPSAVELPEPSLSMGETIDKSVKNSSAYLLQVASFRKMSDAERMKAVLAFKGFVAVITTTSAQNVLWYRVNIGPFDSLTQAQKAQVSLAHGEKMIGMIRKAG